MTEKDSISRLLSIASAPLCGLTVVDKIEGFVDSHLKLELRTLLMQRNGFYCFEGALHVFPSTSSLISVGLDEWNAPNNWRSEYGELADGCLFFAEDAFGGQFCIRSGGVFSFEPETGKTTKLCDSIAAWAMAILDDFEFLTGHPIIHAWQLANGPIPENSRLVPRIPFVCGGSYDLENLVLMDSTESMQIRGRFAKSIQNVPDGGVVDGWF